MAQIEEYLKMTTHREFLNELVRANGLIPPPDEEDLFQLKFGNKAWIIKRTGIEKIQFNNDIHVRYEVIAMQPDYVVIKAIASKGFGVSYAKDAGDLVVESFGEATPENTKQKPPYYSAMAEKRALSRVVLKLCGAYKHGVYGEDEADDFKHKKD